MNMEIQATGEILTPRDRWMAAVSYLSLLVFVPLLQKDRSAFVTRHVRQGFALLFAEIVGVALLYIIENTIGRIPFLGVLITILVYLTASLGFLAISVFGFIRAAAGDEFRIPILDDLAEKLPIH